MVNRSSWSLDGHAHHGSEGRDLGHGSLRRRSVAARQAARQADDDELGLLVAHELGDPLVVVAGASGRASSTVSGEAIVPDRSLTATPMRFDPRSSPSARTHRRAAAAGLRGDAQRLVETGRVLAAGGRDVALAAAASADGLGGVA